MGSTRQAGRPADATTLAADLVNSDPRGDVMRAIVQDGYGSTDVLRLAEIDKPDIAANEVLLKVYAAGMDRGTWHVMTGRPYLIRVLGFGFRGPKNPVPGLDVAGTVVTVGSDVTRFQVGEGAAADAAAPSPNTRPRGKTNSPTSQPGSASSRPPSFRSPRSRLSRACATLGASRQDSRC